MLFADNFDYQDMSDFVKGVLAADEVSKHGIGLGGKRGKRKEKIRIYVYRDEQQRKIGRIIGEMGMESCVAQWIFFFFTQSVACL